MPDSKASTDRPPVLTGEQRARLALINRLITNITMPEIARRALLAGYNGREHSEGLALYAKASGADRPFTHALAGADLAGVTDEDGGLERYRPIDAFENEWFPAMD